MNNIVDYRHFDSICWMQAKVIGVMEGHMVLETESFVLEEGNLTCIIKIPLSKVTNYVLPCGTCVLYNWRTETSQLVDHYVEFWNKKNLVLGKIDEYCPNTNRIRVNYQDDSQWFDLNSKHLVYNWEDLR